ncbi:hypothetical protein YTPLAS18_32330 [Nitrospira sp.]|nr:hypothetical protein YTPLAS18_32330 [Nitrospira sp.]
MSNLFLADAIVVLHVAFVAFVIAGGFLAWWWPWVRWIHLPAALWGAVVEPFGFVCPLTPLEQWLRQGDGGDLPAGDFVSRYLFPVLYPEGLTRTMQVILGVLVLLINAYAYGRLWRQAAG